MYWEIKYTEKFTKEEYKKIDKLFNFFSNKIITNYD